MDYGFILKETDPFTYSLFYDLLLLLLLLLPATTCCCCYCCCHGYPVWDESNMYKEGFSKTVSLSLSLSYPPPPHLF